MFTERFFVCTRLQVTRFATVVLVVFLQLMFACALSSSAFATTDFCSGGVLDQGAPLGETGPDLVITNMSCLVDGTKSPYNFHNVYIFGSGMQTGTLTFSDVTMHFYAANILVQNQGALIATGIGANNDGNVLTIHLYGDGSENGITCQKMDGGNLVDDDMCGVPSIVWGSNDMKTRWPSKACKKTSDLDPPTRLPGDVDDCFYPYGMFDSNDLTNAYFGRKVLALSYGGTIQMSGYKGAQGGDDNNPAVTGSSWMRLAGTLTGNGSERSLQVSGTPSDWRMNDSILISSTDYLPGHAEDLKITGVTGSQVGLQTAVKNPHWGQVYSLKNVPCNNEAGKTDCQYGPNLLMGQNPDDRNVDTRAAVGLLSRSIRIVSDGASAGSNFTGFYGGHTLVRQGFLSYQIQGVEFYQLGQGGAKGHYPVHFHMARTVPANTYVKDSSIWDSMTRWITLHATQKVTLARNVGYKSIGHGFYLEDGTETDNIINTNLGVFARAAVRNGQNDRSVPGILAEKGDPGAPNPYHSDWEFPTIFWIMNGWNDFNYNYASSAGTCGACYWLLPGGISGPSQFEWFDGYAGQQIVIPDPDPTNFGFVTDQSGFTPLKTFVGNTCSTAMESLLNIGITAPCQGVNNIPGSGALQGIDNDTAPARQRKPGTDVYYPFVGSLHRDTLCEGSSCRCDPQVPGCNVPCNGTEGSLANCPVTTIDRYTTSFNWAEKNFSAMWLRRWWFLVQNSAITDVQQGGLTFVTGGGYTRSDVAQGYWSVLRNSVMIGNTQLQPGGAQPANDYANSAGPFNPKGLSCDQNPPGVPFCLSAVQGISYITDFFAGNQRMFNIYDGPAHQERNAYLDIPAQRIGKSGECKTNMEGNQQTCSSFKYLYALEFGLPADPEGPEGNRDCYIPNAAIAWKQQNGFFYPPAFHSENLYFSNVDIRHFVIEPLFEYGTVTTSFPDVKKRYCTWTKDLFKNFTDVDRQTVLNDDDGSLTGLLADLGSDRRRETISVNEDNFFNAPTVTSECASDIHAKGVQPIVPPATANTSPYEYVTTATIAKCGINRAGCRHNLDPTVGCDKSTLNSYCAWGWACTAGVGSDACFGVPLYRQLLTDPEWTTYTSNPKNYQRPLIRMMGQSTGQRSTLTANHGKYYIDDQPSLQTQLMSSTELNVYEPNETYYTYFVYAKPSLDQTYQMFVGYGLNKQTVIDSVKQYRANIATQDYKFTEATGDPKFISVDYDDRPQGMGTGLVTIRISLSLTAAAKATFEQEFKTDTPKFCQPRSYCAPDENDDTKCVCAPDTDCKDSRVCRWAVKDIDCPIDGCFAFGITMPGNFSTGIALTPPVPSEFSKDTSYNWGLPFFEVNKNVSGAQCNYQGER